MIRIAVFISTAGYLGYAPVAPGTVGSAAGLAVYGVIRLAGGGPAIEIVTIALLLALGVWAGTIAERFFGGIDPGPVVVDEVAGMLITLALLPVGWSGAVAGFCLFRLLDVIKPFPSGRLERWSGGWGVMADDALAAVYANLGLRGVMWLLPEWIR